MYKNIDFYIYVNVHIYIDIYNVIKETKEVSKIPDAKQMRPVYI
jgi:hypothetical protein